MGKKTSSLKNFIISKMGKINPIYKIIIRLLISIIIIIALIKYVDLNKLLNEISLFSPKYLALAILTKLFSLYFAALNFKILLMGTKKIVKFHKILLASSLAWTMGLFSPGRAGEFSLIFLLRKEISIGEGTALTILDKLSTLIVLSFMAILGGIIYYLNINYIRLLVIILIIILIILIISLIYSNKLSKKIEGLKIINKIIDLKKFKGFNRVIRKVLIKERKIFLMNMFITIIKWSFSFIAIKFIFLSLGHNANLITIGIITSISTLSSLIPITFGGLGIRESTAVYLFAIQEVEKHVSLAVYLINTVFNYIFGFIIIMISIIVYKEKLIKRKKIT